MLFPPTTAATLNLAATAAQCARLWQHDRSRLRARAASPPRRAPIGRRCANPDDLCLAEFDRQRRLWRRAICRTSSTGRRPSSMRPPASPELLRALQRAAALHRAADADAPSWSNVAALGTITLAVAAGVVARSNVTPRARSSWRPPTASSPRRRARATTFPMRRPRYPWGSNGDILNRGMILGLAARFTGQARYRDGAVDALDYVLGRNPLDQSYVSGFGWNADAATRTTASGRISSIRGCPGRRPGVLSRRRQQHGAWPSR